MADQPIIELKIRNCGGNEGNGRCIYYYYGQCSLEPTWKEMPPEHHCGRGIWLEWTPDQGTFLTYFHGEPKQLIPPDAYVRAVNEARAKQAETQAQAPVPTPPQPQPPPMPMPTETPVEIPVPLPPPPQDNKPRPVRVVNPPMSMDDMLNYFKNNPKPPGRG